MAHRITLEHSMGSLTPSSLWPLNPSPLLTLWPSRRLCSQVTMSAPTCGLTGGPLECRLPAQGDVFSPQANFTVLS